MEYDPGPAEAKQERDLNAFLSNGSEWSMVWAHSPSNPFTSKSKPLSSVGVAEKGQNQAMI
jgi:hypothetical protein